MLRSPWYYSFSFLSSKTINAQGTQVKPSEKVTLNLLDATEADLESLNEDLKEFNLEVSFDKSPDPNPWYTIAVKHTKKVRISEVRNTSIMDLEIKPNAEMGKPSLQLKMSPIPVEIREEGQTGIQMHIPKMTKDEEKKG